MKRWSDVRAEAVRDGRLNEGRVDEVRCRRLAEVRGHRLAELRNAFGLTLEELAGLAGISRSEAERIESGQLDQVPASTLRTYVRVLSGGLELSARFGDERVILEG